MKFLASLVVIVGGIAVAWYVFTSDTVRVPTTSEVIIEPSHEEVSAVAHTGPDVVDVVWDMRLIEDGVGDPLSAPYSDVAVTLVLSDKTEKGVYRLGSFEGSCSEQPLHEERTSAVSRAVCWFAGAGTEFEVIQEGGVVRVLSRGVDEGSAEVSAAEESFSEILLVSL